MFGHTDAVYNCLKCKCLSDDAQSKMSKGKCKAPLNVLFFFKTYIDSSQAGSRTYETLFCPQLVVSMF